MPPQQEDITVVRGVTGLIEDITSMVGEDREIVGDGVIREEKTSDNQLMMASGTWQRK